MVRRYAIWVVPALAWLAFAGWLALDYADKVASEKASLRAQGASILIALESGIGGLGRFDVVRLEHLRAAAAEMRREIEDLREEETLDAQQRIADLEGRIEAMTRFRLARLAQLQASLEELVRSPSVFAVSILDKDAHTIVSAGHPERWSPATPVDQKDVWLDGALMLTRKVPAQRTKWMRFDFGRRFGRGSPHKGSPHKGASPHRDHPPPGPIYARLVMSQGKLASILRQHAAMADTAGAVGLLAAIVLAAVWALSVKSREQAAALELAEAQNQYLREMQLAGAGLAHEIKNPLNVLRGTAQSMVERAQTSGQDGAALERMLNEIDRMVARLDEFLSYSRVPTPEMAPVPAREVVEQVAELLEFGAASGSPPIVVDDLPVIRSDRGLFRQVMFNLLHNALRASDEGGRVQVRCVNERGPTVRLEVADDGVGVPDELRPELFKPYCSGWEGGTGLGLSIVRQIALAHNWKVGYRPNGGRGSVFWIGNVETAADDE